LRAAVLATVFLTVAAGAVQATKSMLVAIGFLAILTATVATHFVTVDQQETTTRSSTLGRLEVEVADLKSCLAP
jgi:hypothetical protein